MGAGGPRCTPPPSAYTVERKEVLTGGRDAHWCEATEEGILDITASRRPSTCGFRRIAHMARVTMTFVVLVILAATQPAQASPVQSQWRRSLYCTTSGSFINKTLNIRDMAYRMYCTFNVTPSPFWHNCSDSGPLVLLRNKTCVEIFTKFPSTWHLEYKATLITGETMNEASMKEKIAEYISQPTAQSEPAAGSSHIGWSVGVLVVVVVVGLLTWLLWRYKSAPMDRIRGWIHSLPSLGVFCNAAGADNDAAKHNNSPAGKNSQAAGNDSHAAGDDIRATGNDSHAAGDTSQATGNDSRATGNDSHAAEDTSQATGKDSRATGDDSQATEKDSHATGKGSHATGDDSQATEDDSQATGDDSHATGDDSQATGKDSHATGKDSHATGKGSQATGDDSQATGKDSHAKGDDSQATGDDSQATGKDSHATGDDSQATGDDSQATGKDSHAKGDDSQATGDDSQATGDDSQATGKGSHATGDDSQATGDDSQATGDDIALNPTRNGYIIVPQCDEESQLPHEEPLLLSRSL
ncbi:autotransporter adhesin BpaC-like [Dendropsophus ebraccatus]|uniref:autotransporter adhesin BpaC-like n=1 Tax=Dendropsophus ebraccatus TaxID=150705 RepID=UPI003831E7EB